MPEVICPDGAAIHYEVSGHGYPLLLLAPGGVSSQIEFWQRSAFNPIDVLSDSFTVIGMDQRYAGASRAPLTPFSYARAMHDQLAVLDDLGIRRAHVMGGCIGCTHALRLLDDAPARITAAVLQDPVGIDDTNGMDTFYAMFNETIRTARADGLDAVVAAAEREPAYALNHAAGPWSQRLHDEPAFRRTVRSLGREGYIALVVDFRDGIWPSNPPYFSVNEVAVQRIEHPLLVLPGSDPFHPTGIGRKICEDAVNARCLDVDARADDKLAGTIEKVRDFLLASTPAGGA